MLDWTNVYGIRLLLPFFAHWFHLDITDIVDPWIWAILLLACIAPWLSRLVGSEIASGAGTSKLGDGAKRGWAWFAILALLSYEGARFLAHHRAIEVMNAHLYDGAPAQRISALPRTFTSLRWQGVIEGDGFVRIAPVDLTANFDPDSGRVEYPAPASPTIEAASRTRPFEIFGQFDQLPFWQVTPTADGTLVELIDLRFGTPQHPGFAASAKVDGAGRVVDAQFGFGGIPQPK